MSVKGMRRYIYCIIIGLLFGATYVYRRLNKEYEYLTEMLYKKSIDYRFLHNWIEKNINCDNLEKSLLEKGYINIAIYGMGDIGKLICKELEKTEISVKYGIDRNSKNIKSTIKLYGLEEKLPEVDAVIITISHDFDNIRNILIKKYDYEIVSLFDIFG